MIKNLWLKKSVEELTGIVFIGLIVILLFSYYLVSHLRTPDNTDFDWKKYHLEYIVQVLLNYNVVYSPKCSISFQEFLTNIAQSPSKLPSCYTEFVNPTVAEAINEQLLENVLENYFNTIKSPGESYYISINFGNFKKEIEIKGYLGNYEFNFRHCILQPFSLKEQYILSRDVVGLGNYVKISYCKLVK